ncbi:MAG TPA: choice-of-anchor D domain-containing protein, partial [Acidobacteriaceae bacterium]|nr:choice-of-anchor D domain-containing protein [Acidobacteriaceae bacterium]
MTLHRKVLFHSTLAILVGLALSGCGTSTPSSETTNSSFDFGKVVVSQTSTRDVVTITNSGDDAATLNSQLQGDASLKLQPNLSCGASLAPGGSCSMAVSFTPATSGPVSGALKVAFTGGMGGGSSQTVQLTGTGVQLSGGESLVTPTANPLVALYSFQPEQQGAVHVEFGTDTNYGRSTGSVTPVNGGPVSILVAGMKQNTAYHMRAVVTESDGTVVNDQDHTFTTGSFPADTLPTSLTATTSPGQTPQPGIELLDSTAIPKSKSSLEAYAVDLSGNIIWGYPFPDRPTANTSVQPIKLLPNGNFLMVLSFLS